MDDLYHPAFIEEWKQNIDAAAYENKLNQDVKIPSINKTIDHNDKTEYWTTSIKESLNCLPFYTMEFTAYRIENDKKLLPSLLNLFSMFKIKCWYSLGVAEIKT